MGQLKTKVCTIFSEPCTDLQRLAMDVSIDGRRSVKVTNMGAELQSQNRVDVNYEKNTVPIYLKF